MAHELSILENGMVEFSYTGEKTKIWHGLGNEISEDSTIDEWCEKTFNYTIKKSPEVFFADDGAMITNPDNFILYRSDNYYRLGGVTKNYHVVQPQEVIGFFDELVRKHDMKLSAAGAIFNGKTYWATAKTGKNTNIMGEKDEVEGYILLTSSADGKTATICCTTSERSICKNTLQIALNNAKNIYRQSHKSPFDVNQARLDLGLIESSWNAYIDNLHKLAETKMDDKQVQDFYREMYMNERNEISKTDEKNVDNLIHLYNHGAGSNIVYGTAWGALNAVTNLYTHGNGRKRDPSGKFWSNYMGDWNKIKNDAFERLLEAA